jgi:hypothetical protein
VNIFYLDDCPHKAARYQCDKHVVKMTLESAQMLCGAHHDSPYKITHKNHPCSVWVREGKDNYIWLLEHFEGLCTEYTHRYERIHLCESKLLTFLQQVPAHLPEGGTPFRPAIGEYNYDYDLVQNYRRFYSQKRHRFKMVWTSRSVPFWFPLDTLCKEID